MNLSIYKNNINFRPSASLSRQTESLFKSYVTMEEKMALASKKILSEGKGIVSRGKSLYQELIKEFHGTVEYKNPNYEATEKEIEIINKIAEKRNLPVKTKEKLIGLLIEDGKIMGNKTLLDRFAPGVTMYQATEREVIDGCTKHDVTSGAFDTALYSILGFKPKIGPGWTQSSIYGDLGKEAINLTGAKGTIDSAELVECILTNKGISLYRKYE